MPLASHSPRLLGRHSRGGGSSSALWLLTLLCLPLLANGYLVGRLLSLQNVADAQRQLLEATSSGDYRMLPSLVLSAPMPTMERGGDLGPEVVMEANKHGGGGKLATESGQETIPAYAKKSLMNSYGGYKSLGNGSRNCFFTPIQCMIQHDMDKYRKLVDGRLIR